MKRAATISTSHPERTAHLMMLVAMMIFAVNFIIGRWAVGDTPPYLMGFVRWGGGMMILLPFTWNRVWKDRGFIRRHWKLLCLAGFMMPFMVGGVSYVAMTHTSAINAGVIVTSTPVMMVLLSWLILKERITGAVWLGISLAIAGVLYMVSRGNPALLLSLAFNIGDLILVFSCLGVGVYGVTIKKLPAGLHPLSLLTVICAVGAFCHVPFVAYEMAAGEQVVVSVKSAVSLTFLAIFPSVVAILIWNSAIGRIGPSRSTFYMYLIPVFTAVLAVPLLGESIGVYHVVGTGLIIVGVTLASRKARGKTAPEASRAAR
jgi:drug/metabolite transporter (DMT)-like permease